MSDPELCAAGGVGPGPSAPPASRSTPATLRGSHHMPLPPGSCPAPQTEAGPPAGVWSHRTAPSGVLSWRRGLADALPCAQVAGGQQPHLRVAHNHQRGGAMQGAAVAPPHLGPRPLEAPPLRLLPCPLWPCPSCGSAPDPIGRTRARCELGLDQTCILERVVGSAFCGEGRSHGSKNLQAGGAGGAVGWSARRRAPRWPPRIGGGSGGQCPPRGPQCGPYRWLLATSFSVRKTGPRVKNSP